MTCAPYTKKFYLCDDVFGLQTINHVIEDQKTLGGT